MFLNCRLAVISFEHACMIKCVESCFQDSPISSHVLFCIFLNCCIKWFIIQLDLGLQPRLASLSHLAHEDWTHCYSNSKWRNGEIDYKQIGIILAHVKEKQGIKCCINLNIIRWQLVARKLFSNYFHYTWTMINILVIFLTHYFQGKKMI
jgi:hypothetical protein